MIQFFQKYSFSEVIIFLFLFLIALRQFSSLLDWLRGKGLRFFKKKYQQPRQLEQTVKELTQEIDKISKKVDLLLQSDKDDIKSFITREHHYFCYRVRAIDDQSLDCIEKRYSHYKEQGGNSYIADLMQDLRKLPKKQNNDK